MHAMQTIADSGLAPIRKEDKPAHAHIHAHSIFAAFSDSTVEARRMSCVYAMAVGDQRLTQDQLESELAAALKMAVEADINNGWVAPEGAKGTAKYGPKRASMNTVSSEIRQVWGGITHCNLAADRTSDGVAKEPTLRRDSGYAFAVKEARKALKQQQIRWDGSQTPTEEQKAESVEAKAMAAEMATYAKNNPIKAGETIAAFQTRQQQAVEIAYELGKQDREAELVKKTVDSIWGNMSPEQAMSVADELYNRWNAHCDVMAQQELTQD